MTIGFTTQQFVNRSSNAANVDQASNLELDVGFLTVMDPTLVPEDEYACVSRPSLNLINC